MAPPEIVVKIHRTPGLQDGVVGLSEEAMQWMQAIIGGRCECPETVTAMVRVVGWASNG